MRLAMDIRPMPSSPAGAGRGEQSHVSGRTSVQAAVRPPGGGWGAPVTLTTGLYFGGGGIVLGMDGTGNAIAA